MRNFALSTYSRYTRKFINEILNLPLLISLCRERFVRSATTAFGAWDGRALSVFSVSCWCTRSATRRLANHVPANTSRRRPGTTTMGMRRPLARPATTCCRKGGKQTYRNHRQMLQVHGSLSSILGYRSNFWCFVGESVPVEDPNKPDDGEPGSQRQYSLQDFELIRVIGRGSYAKVLMVELKRTKRIYAMKVIKKALVTDDEDIDWVQTEKHVFETASNHPFLVGLHSCFQTPSRLFFVIEFVRGGDLMFHMQRQRRLPEEHAR